jgi:predicted ArsR family transcriptional regulator
VYRLWGEIFLQLVQADLQLSLISGNRENIAREFSDPKKKLLYYLKIMQSAELDELANVMKMSRMAVHKHLASLQQRGLVEGTDNRGHVGRPRIIYQLTSQSKTAFPKSYSGLAIHALNFVEKNLGEEGVEKVLRERQNELFNKYYTRLKKLNFDKQVKELAKIRDEEGYIAESRSKSDGKHVLLEYNCPVIDIAEKHWKACSVEAELFEKLLDVSVDATHTAVKGDSICKFVINKRKEGYL